MIPLSDDPPRRSAPMVTVALIGINVLVFLYEQSLGSQLQGFIQAFGAIPQELTSGHDLGPHAPLGNVYLTVLTSIFLHGGWLHLLSNMLYLWIFGDNVEDAFGHVAFLGFYLVCGVAATAAQVAVNVHSTVPSVGASGAIAGVLGAYLMLYPSATVRTLLFLGPIILLPRLPAIFLIGFWFVTQLLSAIAQLGVFEETGGVAFWAHVGGFVIGALITWLWRPRPMPAAPSRNW